MAAPNEKPPASAASADAAAATAATETDAAAEPEGPDLSALSAAGRELLQAALSVLAEYEPQPGALNDLPQVSIDRRHLLDACRRMKEHPDIAARMLLCLAAVDYAERFQLVYFLQSLEPERTLALKADLPYDDPAAPSVASVWRAADWYEREAHDLFGVNFEGHPDLAPLLLYDDFEGYPGRKEFPFYEYREF